MAWLYLPEKCVSSPSARASADSTSASGSPIRQPGASVMSKGRAMPPRSLSAAWKKKPWMRHLSGLTLEPSTASLGVERWISSLADTPARGSPAPAGCSASATPATCGPTSGGSSPRSGQSDASLRTSATIYEWASSKSTMTFRQWASALRRACSLRLKSGRTTSGNGSSSSPTVVVSDSFGGRNRTSSRPADSRHHAGTTLTDHLLGPYVVDGRLQTDLRLNPSFTEAMLGWPPEWTGCGPAATELSRWWRLMRGEFSKIVSGLEPARLNSE